MEPNRQTSEAAAVAEITRQNILPTIEPLGALGSGSPPYAVHRDGRIESLERLLHNPLRIEAKVQLDDVRSFCEYVQRMAEAGTALFAREGNDQLQISAVLDYHVEPGSPQRCRHVATLGLLHSEEWKAWTRLDKQLCNQAALARFVEDRCFDIAAPAPAEMLEMVKTLEATQNVEFKSALRLDNGDRDFAYTVATGAKAGANGSLTIPSIFTIRIPVFVDMPAVEISARFRWNIDGGQLRLGFEFIQLDKVRNAAIAQVREAVQSAVGRPVWSGCVTL
jgi:uncharacterized protein YfdQ (DUF2303 family)